MAHALSEEMADLIRQIKSDLSDPPSGHPSPIAKSMAQLCYYSYDNPIDLIHNDVSNPKHVFPPREKTRWKCTWGPSIDWAEGDVAYVAGLFHDDPVDPLESPFLVAVVIRGTDDANIWSSLQDFYQDATPIPQLNPTWNTNTNEWIANGTMSALANIQSLVSNDLTLLQYLQWLPSYRGREPIIIVTGHSLGGCTATVVGPWLTTALPPKKTAFVVPYTFAAPTAGNQAFVGDLLRVCPLTHCYYNPLDCIPYAWADLNSIDDLYGTPSNAVVDAWVAATNGELATYDYFSPSASYAQVPNRNIPYLPSKYIPVSGSIPGTEFMSELLAQHAIANYMLLMGLPAPSKAFSPSAPRMQRLEPSQAA